MLAMPGSPGGPGSSEAIMSASESTRGTARATFGPSRILLFGIPGAEPVPAAPHADELDRPPSSLEAPCESWEGSSKGDAGEAADPLLDTVQEVRKDVSHRFVEDVVDMEVAATPRDDASDAAPGASSPPKRAKDEYDLMSESSGDGGEDGAPALSMLAFQTEHFHEAAQGLGHANPAEDEAAVTRYRSVAYAEDVAPAEVDAEDDEDVWREPASDMLAFHSEHFAEVQPEDDEDVWREPGPDMLAFHSEHFAEAAAEACEDVWREPPSDMLAFHSEHFAEAPPEDGEDMFGEVDPSMLTFHSGHFDEVEEQTCGPLMAELSPDMLAFQSEHFREAEEEAEALAALPMEASMLSFHTEHFTEGTREEGPDGADQPRDGVRDKLCEADLRLANNVPSSAALLVLQAVSQRDRRIGELTAQVASAERRISDGDRGMREMEKQIGSLKMDAAHFDLDIEWYRRALRNAEARAAELEAKPAPANVLKFKPGPADQSTRSEISTATGTSGQTRLWTPQTPRQQALGPLITSPLSAA